jgi:methionyl-tRNA formyltransferase
MIGAHASLQSRYRSAPINWALIRGDPETGNRLFWLAENPVSGELVDERRIPITLYDTCASLYQKVAATTQEMLLRLVPRLLAGERPVLARAVEPEPALPRRRPADGVIDWSRDGRAVYDLIRALTRPYPGAFSRLDGRRWVIWQAALPPCAFPATEAGEIVGPVVSPIPEACGLAVACGTGGIVLLELEDEHGVVLSGRALSDQPWTGRRWSHD